jgi:hypothetical protein
MEYGGYNVFVRNWWLRDPSASDGRTPGPGPKRYIAKGVTESRARELCREYNGSHNPGKYSRKAEYESA